LVDALASGASVLMDVEVRVFSWAPFLLLIAAHIRAKPLIYKDICANILNIAKHSIPPIPPYMGVLVGVLFSS